MNKFLIFFFLTLSFSVFADGFHDIPWGTKVEDVRKRISWYGGRVDDFYLEYNSTVFGIDAEVYYHFGRWEKDLQSVQIDFKYNGSGSNKVEIYEIVKTSLIKKYGDIFVEYFVGEETVIGQGETTYQMLSNLSLVYLVGYSNSTKIVIELNGGYTSLRNHDISIKPDAFPTPQVSTGER